MIGRQIARYRIVEQIGSGGMSVVYKGLDTALEREVAVKVLHPHLASKEESRRRFSREARAVAKLHHPNILEIFDFSGDEAPESFIVTEYIRGTTLRTFAEKQQFHPPEIAAMAVHELASALEHAHAVGIIHRDLKPENVMIREDGIIKLMDFGIARIVDRDERMTMTGALVGSPAHMAPEIIEGQEAGREADIFSLGTILYWLCCRRLPFLGNNTTQTLKLVLEGTFEDPRISNPAVSDELASIVARCLARDPAARYPSANELRDALADCLARVGVERPGEEFVAFFGDPDGFRPRFEKRLVDQLLAEAERCSGGADRNLARALDCLNRVLALQPQNERARQMLDAMKRRRRRAKRLAIAGGVAAALSLLGAAGTVAWQHRGDDSHPAAPAGAVATDSTPGKPTVTTPVVTRDPVQPDGVTPGPGTATAGTAAAGTATAGTPTAGNPSAGTPTAANPTAGNPTAGTPSAGNPTAGNPSAGTSGAGSRPDPGGDKPAVPERPKSVDGGKKVALVSAGGAAAARTEPRNVVIKFTPPHYARIFLDGKLVNENRPWFEGPATPGRHELRIESGSCAPYAGEIVVPADGATVPPFIIKLERKPALLSIKTPLRDAIVMINGTFRGRAGDSERDPIAVPLPDSRVKGTVRIALTHEGYLPRELDVEVAAGETKVVPVELEKP